MVGGGRLKSNIVSVPIPLRGLGRPRESRLVTGKGWVVDGKGMGRGA